MHTTFHPYQSSSAPFKSETKIINRNHILNFWSDMSLIKIDRSTGEGMSLNHFHVVMAYEDELTPVPNSVVSSRYSCNQGTEIKDES